MADFGLKNQILARANSARFVFEKIAAKAGIQLPAQKTSFLDGCCQESYTKKAGQQILTPRSTWNFSLFKVRLGKLMKFDAWIWAHQ